MIIYKEELKDDSWVVTLNLEVDFSKMYVPTFRIALQNFIKEKNGNIIVNYQNDDIYYPKGIGTIRKIDFSKNQAEIHLFSDIHLDDLNLNDYHIEIRFLSRYNPRHPDYYDVNVIEEFLTVPDNHMPDDVMNKLRESIDDMIQQMNNPKEFLTIVNWNDLEKSIKNTREEVEKQGDENPLIRKDNS